MSRSASNATGQLVEKAWAPVKSIVRDGASVCMGEPPGGGNNAGSGASAEVGGAASRPGPQQQVRPSHAAVLSEPALFAGQLVKIA